MGRAYRVEGPGASPDTEPHGTAALRECLRRRSRGLARSAFIAFPLFTPLQLTYRTPLKNTMRNRVCPVLILIAAGAFLLPARQLSFSDKIYPILERAACRNCHNVEGVASATRLHFPDEDAAKARVEIFGKSLVEFVDRQNPANSILLLKPTLRVPHTGGERITKDSPDEAALKSWIAYLSKLSATDVTEALRYRREETAGYGIAPKVV